MAIYSIASVLKPAYFGCTEKETAIVLTYDGMVQVGGIIAMREESVLACHEYLQGEFYVSENESPAFVIEASVEPSVLTSKLQKNIAGSWVDQTTASVLNPSLALYTFASGNRIRLALSGSSIIDTYGEGCYRVTTTDGTSTLISDTMHFVGFDCSKYEMMVRVEISYAGKYGNPIYTLAENSLSSFDAQEGWTESVVLPAELVPDGSEQERTEVAYATNERKTHQNEQKQTFRLRIFQNVLEVFQRLAYYGNGTMRLKNYSASQVLPIDNYFILESFDGYERFRGTARVAAGDFTLSVNQLTRYEQC